jgi:quinol monooxygenase YgiN
MLIMIKIIAKMPVKADQVAQFKALAQELVAKSAAEEGNVSYSLNVSQADPNTFAILECWRDQAAIDFHNNTPHFTTLLPQMSALCSGDIAIDLYDEI